MGIDPSLTGKIVMTLVIMYWLLVLVWHLRRENWRRHEHMQNTYKISKRSKRW